MGSGADQNLGTRTLRGMFWAYGSYVGGRVLVLISTALLARLLSPEDFGLVAIAVVCISFLEILHDLGLTQALMLVSDNEVEERAHTVWIVSVGIGAALAVVMAALGPLAAAFFDQPELVAIMPVLGLNLLLKSLGLTHYALAQKKLDFRTRTGAEFADVAVRATLGIALALAGFGAWSLVLGYVAGTLAKDVALWALVRWRPRMRFRRDHLSGLLSFGGAVTAVSVLGAIMGTADDLIVGRVLGASELGLYVLAYRIPELLVLNLSIVAGQVLFPAMSTLDRTALPAAFLTSLRYGLMVGLPLAAGLAILAEPLVVAVFGEKWLASVPAMQVMALWTLMSPIGIIIGSAYKSMGRADILLKLAVPQTVLIVGSVLIVAGDGIVAVAACQAAVAISFTTLATFVVIRILDLRWRDLLRAGWPAVVGAAVLAVVVLPIERSLDSPWPTLIVAALAGGAAYAATLWVVARDTVQHLIRLAFARRRATPGAAL